jgi:hypothetical protein
MLGGMVSLCSLAMCLRTISEYRKRSPQMRQCHASQRETKFDRALRRARKLRLRLGGDPADDEYPDKPPRMRWTTYHRLMDKLVAAEGTFGALYERARVLRRTKTVTAMFQRRVHGWRMN